MGGNKEVTLTLQATESKEEKSRKITVYKVNVRCGDNSHFVTYRYSEFSSLLDRIKKIFNVQLQNVKLPHKKFFSAKTDTELVKYRCELLNDFLQRLSAVENLASNADVRAFFNLSEDGLLSPGNTNDSTLNLYKSSDDLRDTEELSLGESNNPKAKPTDFTFLKVIGKGSFGRVFLAKHNVEEKFYAVKVLNKDIIVKRNETKHIMAERSVLLQNVKHPFLVSLCYSFQTHDKLYFVLDYVNGGEMFFHLQKEKCFNEARSRFYAAEIGQAIGYLHSVNIIYRDLKPENILLDSVGHIVLTDFGLAKQCMLPNQTTNTFCGTPEYLAPEVLLKQPYDKSVDWWCYGCVLFEMLSGLPPFYSRDMSEMYDNILNNPPKFKLSMSLVSKSILEGLLQKDRTARLGFGPTDFEEIKVHPFFRPIDWDELYQKKIKPPFNPGVKNDLDLSNIDQEFVAEEVTASVDQRGVNPLLMGNSLETGENPFVGFSYVPANKDLLDDDND